jgi:hypothetical protein
MSSVYATRRELKHLLASKSNKVISRNGGSGKKNVLKLLKRRVNQPTSNQQQRRRGGAIGNLQLYSMKWGPGFLYARWYQPTAPYSAVGEVVFLGYVKPQTRMNISWPTSAVGKPAVLAVSPNGQTLQLLNQLSNLQDQQTDNVNQFVLFQAIDHEKGPQYLAISDGTWTSWNPLTLVKNYFAGWKLLETKQNEKVALTTPETKRPATAADTAMAHVLLKIQISHADTSNPTRPAGQDAEADETKELVKFVRQRAQESSSDFAFVDYPIFTDAQIQDYFKQHKRMRARRNILLYDLVRNYIVQEGLANKKTEGPVAFDVLQIIPNYHELHQLAIRWSPRLQLMVRNNPTVESINFPPQDYNTGEVSQMFLQELPKFKPLTEDEIFADLQKRWEEERGMGVEQSISSSSTSIANK